MFTSNVSITSRDGYGALVSTAEKTVSLDQLTAGTRVSGPTMGADLLSPAARDAMSRIFDLVAQMEGRAPKTDPETTKAEIGRSQTVGREELTEKAEWASMTKDDAVRYLLSDEYVARQRDGLNDRQIGLRTALANGTATVMDLEEAGVRSEVTYTVHFNEYGGYSGGSMRFDVDQAAYDRFRDDNIVRNDDGTMTDRKTGKNAALVQLGGVQLYVTWP